MFSIWARKRPVNGVGYPFEWICNFENEQAKFYLTDQLDREIYEECLVMEGRRLVLYREFEKPHNRIKKRW